MTRLNWDKADYYPPDAGAVIDVSDAVQPSRWVPPAELARRRAERADEERERVKRMNLLLEAVRLEAMVERIACEHPDGGSLSFWDKALLERWEEIRACLPTKI